MGGAPSQIARAWCVSSKASYAMALAIRSARGPLENDRPIWGRKTTVTAQTDRDLYRLGNSFGARFDEILPRDVTIHSHAGAGYVYAGRGEGISTLEAVGTPPPPKGKWWCLPNGSTYDDSVLILVGDPALPSHWQWEPRWDMHVDTYRAALTDLQMKFIPMWHRLVVATAKGPSP